MTAEDLEEFLKRTGHTKKTVVISALKLYMRLKDTEEYYRKKYPGKRFNTSIEFRPIPDGEESTTEERLAGLLIY